MFYYCGPSNKVSYLTQAAAECLRNNQAAEEAIVSHFLIIGILIN